MRRVQNNLKPLYPQGLRPRLRRQPRRCRYLRYHPRWYFHSPDFRMCSLMSMVFRFRPRLAYLHNLLHRHLLRLHPLLLENWDCILLRYHPCHRRYHRCHRLRPGPDLVRLSHWFLYFHLHRAIHLCLLRLPAPVSLHPG